MIDTYEKFRLPDENKAHEMFAEVNWNTADEKTNKCQFVKLTLGDKEVLVRKEHFIAFLFAIGTGEEQMGMIPQTITKTRWYETVVSVKATKDIRKGEEVTFPLKLTLPDTNEAVIGDVRKTLNTPKV